MDQPTIIAKTILAGFERHYATFRNFSQAARAAFEQAQWAEISRLRRLRIASYDQRVNETVELLETDFRDKCGEPDLWAEIKTRYIGLLMDHLQAECAETFFNSVACRVLHRDYYQSEYIFWRPTISTDHLEGTQPIYNAHYPASDGLRRCLLEILTGTGLGNRFENIRRDIRLLEAQIRASRTRHWRALSSHQVQVLASPFFRNKAVYLVAREVNGEDVQPMVFALLLNENRELYVDALLMRRKDIRVVFSFTRAYFLTDMEVPSAYVDFLVSIMPSKSLVDLYSMLGLQKHAKTLFYRGMQYHLKHSRDNFRLAPGIPGLVMLVFTLPSFPFVFKIIRDHSLPPKTVSREQVMDRYLLVKHHDRVGRLADTLEYSNVAIPLDRIDPELLAELKRHAPSMLEVDGDRLIISHVYIERRMIPLNEYLATAKKGRKRRAIRDYGQAIRDLAGVNIFPGDMMQKNFGITRTQRVVFYDYDEICYLSDCSFRKLPEARYPDDEMSEEPWFSVQDRDVFPETFASLFFPRADDRDLFLEDHQDLMDPGWWKSVCADNQAGIQADVHPYPLKRKLRER